MNSIALSIGLSALSGFGDVEFHGVGQTAVSVVDDVETLDTRLIFGAFGESEGAVYGFAFETIDNLDDVGLFQAYVGADFGGLDVTVGRFQRNFSAELATSTFGYTYGLTNSTVFDRYDAFVEGVSFGGEAGDASFAIDVVGDDVFDVFKSLITADTWVREISKTVLGKPIDPTTGMEQ